MLLVKNLIFTVVVPGTVAVYVPIGVIARYGSLAVAWSVEQYFALLPLLAGAAVYARCVWDFATAGQGTPAPIDAPRHLVVRGLYRYIRNPMYVGVLLGILGWAVFFRSLGLLCYACGVGLTFHLFVVLYEEPRLRGQFGESYELYCRAVGRWTPGRAINRLPSTHVR